MCLDIAITRPNDVLNSGEHLGFEWMVIHNRSGYRCGYVRVPAGHPWHGKDDADCDVHGGITFARADIPCDKGGDDTAWWLGFDCAHYGDAPDQSLPLEHKEWADINARYSGDPHSSVRGQQYVEHECRRLCEQAAAAAVVA